VFMPPFYARAGKAGAKHSPGFGKGSDRSEPDDGVDPATGRRE
jgi:hypothetical protein